MGQSEVLPHAGPNAGQAGRRSALADAEHVSSLDIWL
jgi:hypothetical protein